MNEHTKHARLRDADFTAKLEQIASSFCQRGINATANDIIEAALMSRPKQYYLSLNYVMRQLSALRKTGYFERSLPAGTPKAIWHEIDEKVRAYQRRHRRATTEEAVAHLVSFCTPERFYMSRATARRLFNQHFQKRVSYDVR